MSGTEPIGPSDMLGRMLAHNHWANLQLLDACATLSDAQLDARDDPDAWSLRTVLVHIVECQQGYLSLMTRPLGERPPPKVAYEDLRDAAVQSGEDLCRLAASSQPAGAEGTIQTSDGYLVAPWVVLLQVVNHATDHRRQAAGMLRAMGLTPPGMDAWAYGEATGTVTPLPQ